MGLYNCIFGEIFGILPVLTAHQQNRINNDPTSAPLKVLPLLDLERLEIVSECSTKVEYIYIREIITIESVKFFYTLILNLDLFCKYLIVIIGSALNVRFLNTGSSTAINDSCLENIRSTNQLCKLEELKISRSHGLTIKSLYTLLEHCPKLSSIKGIEYWESVSKQVSKKIEQYL